MAKGRGQLTPSLSPRQEATPPAQPLAEPTHGAAIDFLALAALGFHLEPSLLREAKKATAITAVPTPTSQAVSSPTQAPAAVTRSPSHSLIVDPTNQKSNKDIRGDEGHVVTMQKELQTRDGQVISSAATEDADSPPPPPERDALLIARKKLWEERYASEDADAEEEKEKERKAERKAAKAQR